MRAPFLLISGAGLLLAAATAVDAVSSESLPLLRRRSGPLPGRSARRVQDEEDSWEVNVPRTAPVTLGEDRPAWVYYPQAYEQSDDKTLWPLVLMIHGGGSDSSYHDRLLGVTANVDSHGYVALLPNGKFSLVWNHRSIDRSSERLWWLPIDWLAYAVGSPTQQARSTPTGCASGTAFAAVSDLAC